MQIRSLILASCTGALISVPLFASDPPPPQIIGVGSSNAQKAVLWAPYPSAAQYSIWSKTNVAGGFTNDASGRIDGYTWTASNTAPAKFFKLGVTTVSSNAVLTANVLNRLAYGPTPDELERVTAIGPQAYIDEQLAPDAIVDTFDTYTAVVTNGASVG